MIVASQSKPGASFETLSYMLRTISNSSSGPIKEVSDDLLCMADYRRYSGVEYTEEDAVIIMVARASAALLQEQKSFPRQEVLGFLRTFIITATGRIFPEAGTMDIYYAIRGFFEETGPMNGLEGFCYGVVMSHVYSDIRNLNRLCSLDDLRVVILAHIDVIDTRPQTAAGQKEVMIHAFARVLKVFH